MTEATLVKKTSGIGFLTGSFFNCGPEIARISKEGWDDYYNQRQEFKNKMVAVCKDHGLVKNITQEDHISRMRRGNTGVYVTNDTGEIDVRVDILYYQRGSSPSTKPNIKITVHGYTSVGWLNESEQENLQIVFNETKILCTELSKEIGQEYLGFIRDDYYGADKDKIRTLIDAQEPNFSDIEPDRIISGLVLGQEGQEMENTIKKFHLDSFVKLALARRFSLQEDFGDVDQYEWTPKKDTPIEKIRRPGKEIWGIKGSSEKSAILMGVTNEYPQALTENLLLQIYAN